MRKFRWVEEKENTPEAFKIFAKLFIEELEKWAGKIGIYWCMLNLLDKKGQSQ